MSLKKDMKAQAEAAALRTMTVLSLMPNVMQTTAAYQQAENAVPEHQIEVAAPEKAESEAVPNHFSAENDPMEEREELADALRGDAKAAKEPEGNTLTADEIYAKLQMPMFYNAEDLPENQKTPQEILNKMRNSDETFYIGNWGTGACRSFEVRTKRHDMTLPAEERLRFQKEYAGLVRELAFFKTSKVQKTPEQANKLIDRSRIKKVKVEDNLKYDGALAYFSPNSNDITFHKYLPHEQNISDDYLSEYKRGNPIAQANILVHENVHKDHWNYDGSGELYISPINSAKNDRLTETVANAAQYLHAAYQYTLFKEQGIENLSVKRDYTLGNLMLSYNELDKETRPEFSAYLKEAGINTMYFSKRKKVSDILVDYKILPEENKPLLADYLQSRGIEKLYVSENKSMGDMLKEYANWKGEGERPPFDAYIDDLSKEGAIVIQGSDSYSLSDFFDACPEIGSTVENGGDYSKLFEKYGFNDAVSVQLTLAKSVEQLKDSLNQPEKSFKEIINETGLIKDAEYRVVSEKSADVIVSAWKDIEKDITIEEDIWEQLAIRGLSESYVTVHEEMPVEGVLESFSGLKEVVIEHGFDPNDSASVRRVVDASSKYWHEERVDGYRRQMLDAASASEGYFSCQPLSEQIKILEGEESAYRRVSENMLKDVYIGNNMTVDMSHCRDLLDTLSTEDVLGEVERHNRALAQTPELEAQIYEDKIRIISLQEIKEVDAYLSGKGLKTDDEKMAYMAKFMDDMAYRRGNFEDAELTALMLKQNAEMVYPDGMAVTYKPNGTVLANVDGKTYDLTKAMAAKEAEKANEPAQSAQSQVMAMASSGAER